MSANNPINRLDRLLRMEEAIENFFRPGPGVAVPGWHTGYDLLQPYGKTWNAKLDALVASINRDREWAESLTQGSPWVARPGAPLKKRRKVTVSSFDTDKNLVGLYEGECCSQGTCLRPPEHTGEHTQFDGPQTPDCVPMHPVGVPAGQYDLVDVLPGTPETLFPGLPDRI